MQEQERNKSSGMKATMQDQKKQKGASFLEQRKGISLLDEAKNSIHQHPKNARVPFASDAERNLDGKRYRLGDMVWAKVKSHPWWPGQLYDSKLASASALELKRDSCFLVAFFGDSTFGWFAEAELIPFAPNFAQKSKQTSAHNFVDAVEDALDEVRRRVKVGLTCGCCISDSVSDDERKPGLLYDRQLRDIRRTFKPAVLFALMKDLACSPLSSSQNILGNAIARAQADAFRLLVSSRQALEHGGTQVLSDFVPRNQIKGQALNDVGRPEKSKDKYKAEKATRKKHVPAVQGLSREPRGNSTNEKLEGLAKVGKAKQQSMSSSAEKGSTEKSKGFNGEKGGVKGTNLKSKGSKPAEDGVRESRTIDAMVSHEIVASTDAIEERDLGGSCARKAALPESFDARVVLDEVVKDDSSLVVRDSLALNQVKATQTKPEKDLGGPSKKKIVKVPKVDATELQALSTKPTAVAMKVKATDATVGELSKTKVVKKAKTVNVEMEQTIKDADGGVSKTKRMANHDAIEGCDAFPVKVKKRKVSSAIVCNDESDRSLKESVVCSSASDDKTQQLAEEILSDSTGLESDLRQPHVELLVPMEITEDVSAATRTSELDSEVSRLHQDETLQLPPPASNDALAPVVAGPQLHKQGDQLEADQMAVPSLQAKSSADVSKKRKKKPKESSTIEVDASAPFVSGERPLEQEEQLEAELKAISPLQAKDSADITPKTKKKAKNKLPVQPLKPDGDDALVSLAKRLKQGDTLAAEHRVESSLQEKNLMDISKKKKKKLKDPSAVEPHNIDGNTDCLVIGDGKENAKSMETFSIVMENQTSEALLLSPLEADSRLLDTGGIGSSFGSSGAVEALKDIRQKKKEIPAVKHGQKGKKASKSGKEVKESKGLPSFNRVTMSNKRVLEANEHLLKDSRAKSKKVKVDILENSLKSCEGRQDEDGTEQYEDLTKNRKERAHVQDLHEGLLSVSTKPPGFSKEEVHSAAMKDLTNSRKAALYQGPEDSLASVKDANMAVPEASNRNGWESPKISEAAREQTEASSERGGDHANNAEGSKVEDVRTEKEGAQEVLGEGRQSGQNNITTPSKLSKKSVSFSKKVSSSSISLRPAIDVKIPLRGSKEVLNRFGQRVPRLADEAERLGSHPSRTKNATVERALMVSFPQGFPLPSELELTEVFAKFGDLNLPLTSIDSRSGCARIIFRHTQDAEAALRCMKETPVYENARVWLKPGDADVGGLSKQSSKYTERRPALCHSKKLEAKTGSDTLGSRTALDKRVSMSIENDTAIDRHRQEEGNILQNSALGKAGGASAKGGVRDAQLSQSAGAPDKIRTAANSNNAGHESLEAAAPSLSHLPSVGPRSLGMPAANIDISEPFLALLHELHNLVLSIGFKF